jgi:tetratricopeptide (TPR) repeat protein
MISKINNETYYNMKYKLLLYCTITILLFISCNKSSETPDNKKESTIIQESIKVLETISPPDSLIYFAKQKEEKLQLLLSDSLLGKFREDLAVLFYKRSDFNTAKVYFIKSEESYRKANLPLQANQMLANRAVINDLTGDYKEAITIYIKVVDYFKQQNDSTSWASALGNIGAVYAEMGMADKAIHYDKLSLAINLDMGDTLRAATKYNNIGVAFSELKNIPDSAVYYYTKAYKIYKSKGHALYLALVASNLGMQHIMASNLELAEKYLNEAELVFDTLTNINGQGTNQRYYAELY